jgi:hypothetical protein
MPLFHRASMNTKLLSAASLVLFAGCTTTPNTPIAVRQSAPAGDEISYTIVRSSVLHSLNVNETRSLRELHESWLAGDIRSLWAKVQPNSLFALSTEDKARAMRALRLLAVQNERYPVATWNSDTEVAAILKAATADDPKQTAELRARDWSKPW